MERVANDVNGALSRRAILTEDPNLDEFMALERSIDFVQDGRREPRVTDHHARLQLVSTGAHCAALGWTEYFHCQRSAVNREQQTVNRKTVKRKSSPFGSLAIAYRSSFPVYCSPANRERV
jgi:hypothetical protein